MGRFKSPGSGESSHIQGRGLSRGALSTAGRRFGATSPSHSTKTSGSSASNQSLGHQPPLSMRRTNPPTSARHRVNSARPRRGGGGGEHYIKGGEGAPRYLAQAVRGCGESRPTKAAFPLSADRSMERKLRRWPKRFTARMAWTSHRQRRAPTSRMLARQALTNSPCYRRKRRYHYPTDDPSCGAGPKDFGWITVN